MPFNVDPSVADNPIVLYVLLGVSVLSIILSALSKSTLGFNTFLAAIRRIGSDSRAADIAARDVEIQNLSADLGRERKARQSDREYFEKEMARRDKMAREHIAHDWKVYNVLVRAGLWDDNLGDGPPPLF